MTHYLWEYARFDNKSDIDTATKKHVLLHQAELTKSDCQVLDMILKASAMQGAAHLTYQAIMEDTGKSNATVRRAIHKLVRHGIIQKEHYFHPVIGGLGANIYSILPCNEAIGN